MKSLFEQMGGIYRPEGDYFIPNVTHFPMRIISASAYGDSGTKGI